MEGVPQLVIFTKGEVVTGACIHDVDGGIERLDGVKGHHVDGEALRKIIGDKLTARKLNAVSVNGDPHRFDLFTL